jgi:hypothetical protein
LRSRAVRPRTVLMMRSYSRKSSHTHACLVVGNQPRQQR